MTATIKPSIWQPQLTDFQRAILAGLPAKQARALEDVWCKHLNGTYTPGLMTVAMREAGLQVSDWYGFHEAGEGIEPAQQQPRRGSGPEDPGAFPEHLLNCPGYVGDFAKYCCEYGRRPQPVLALGAAVSLMSLLIGRKVCDEEGTRANLYGLAVAPSSAGKEASRSCIKDVMFAAGGSDLVGEGLASTAALVNGMSRVPARLWLIDEVGQWLCGLSSSGDRAPHLQGILPELMKFYSSAHTLYKGNEYKDGINNLQIVQPYCVLFGSSTPEKLYRGLTVDSIQDGFLSRVLIWEAPAEHPRARKPLARKAPDYLIDRAKEWLSYIPGHGNMAAFVPQCDEIQYEPGAYDLINAFDELCDDLLRSESPEFRSLWGRASEKARKLALIRSSSIAQPGRLYSISEADAAWAIELTEYLTKRLIYLASSWISDGKFDSGSKKILRIITEAGEAGIAKADLCRATRSMKPGERDEAIKSLQDSQDIILQTEKTGGRPLQVFYLAEYS
jgi:hypothetical protein